MAKEKDFLELLIANPARARLLRSLILNPNEAFEIASLAKRAGVAKATAVKEVRQLAEIGIIAGARQNTTDKPQSKKRGKKPSVKVTDLIWQANPEFRYARALSVFVHEVAPIRYDDIVDGLKRSGRLATVILSGTFMGDPSRPADLLVAADIVDDRKLETAVRRLEPAYGREIRYASFSTHEFQYRLTVQDRLIRDTLEFPHIVLFDRMRLIS